MQKKRLMTPGPTPVHPAAALALAAPHPHHRTPRFRQLMVGLREKLRQVFRSDGEVVVLTSSGTGAMEAALASLTSPGEEVLVVDSGKFGHRWVELCKSHGRQAHILSPPPRRAISADQVETGLKAHPEVTALFFAACESSTGVRVDTRALAQRAREVAGKQLLIVVDAITEVGAAPLESSAWDLDVVIGGSQKAFMMPPGLALLALSSRALARLEATGGGGYYLDLKREQAAQEMNSTAWTPATALMFALDAALDRMLQTGMEAIWSAVRQRALMTRAGCQAMGLKLFAANPALSLTAVESPAGLDSGRLVATLEEQYGLRLAGGQGPLKGKIFRVAHLGYLDQVETLGLLGALGVTLGRLGVTVDPAAGQAAALKIMAMEN